MRGALRGGGGGVSPKGGGGGGVGGASSTLGGEWSNDIYGLPLNCRRHQLWTTRYMAHVMSWLLKWRWVGGCGMALCAIGLYTRVTVRKQH